MHGGGGGPRGSGLTSTMLFCPVLPGVAAATVTVVVTVAVTDITATFAVAGTCPWPLPGTTFPLRCSTFIYARRLSHKTNFAEDAGIVHCYWKLQYYQRILKTVCDRRS